MNTLQKAKLNLPPFEEFVKEFTPAVLRTGCPPGNVSQVLEQQYAERQRDEVYLNDLYQVNVRRNLPDGWVHLSIKRIDREPVIDWRHKQQIKNELVGPECEAMELYPAESRVVDTANQFHLWAWPNPKERIPVGWQSVRIVEKEDPNSNAKQREPEGVPDEGI